MNVQIPTSQIPDFFFVSKDNFCLSQKKSGIFMIVYAPKTLLTVSTILAIVGMLSIMRFKALMS
ncbi:MAG: hypothetical protein M1G31_14385 [Pseudanabaena sp. Salubria-1]|nr:hypothetical protein [Pseudanabaena sp. Salubria-1]